MPESRGMWHLPSTSSAVMVADTIDFVLFIERFTEAIHCFRLLRPPLSRERAREREYKEFLSAANSSTQN
jgi:hypothetical protein